MQIIYTMKTVDLDDVEMVSDFRDVFPDELSALPLPG